MRLWKGQCAMPCKRYSRGLRFEVEAGICDSWAEK